MGQKYIEGYNLEKLAKQNKLPKKIVKRRNEAIKILRKIGLSVDDISTFSLQKNAMTVSPYGISKKSGISCHISPFGLKESKECRKRLREYIKMRLAETIYNNAKIKTGKYFTIEW